MTATPDAPDGESAVPGAGLASPEDGPPAPGAQPAVPAAQPGAPAGEPAETTDWRPLPGGTAPGAVADLLAALRRRLAGPGREVLLPHAPGAAAPDVRARVRRPVPPGTAVVLATSGSTTGTGHLVALTAEALTASARATEARLAGPGQWLLALPAHHVAGLQVLVRSVLAGTDPVVLDTTDGFDPLRLAEAAGGLRTDRPGYLSLVPTQLVRVLDAGPAAVRPLRRLAAVLLGGAAATPALVERARAAGLPVVTTYGMTETGGGCVYDGTPLPGARVDVAADGRVLLGGPMLAAGYLDDGAADAAAFITRGGERWLLTADRGEVVDGRLRVLGRVDDVINTGGVKVSPAAVERVLGEVGEAVVVGVPDPEWGQVVTAVLAAGPRPAPPLAELRARVRRALGPAHAPRALVVVPELPLRGPGKVDRLAAARLAAAALAGTVPTAAGTGPTAPGTGPTTATGSERVTGIERVTGAEQVDTGDGAARLS
ncbi:o-succinylbenzoate--CoA ligase [Georgenia sp. TF02-10]|uniref:o-succinylbenzoate--CoA ligase n=1 Tax=Georgenia sp. TF02-10 TaxID=2917725 RepID=UPI001FA8021D|nr:o-succinylbenzoate--CoA ligase [Georgenia sp. TF02-10]UNX54428.1 o-succinylbenzoate--CoA ligase [Georgenia sp. TF02-10]